MELCSVLSGHVFSSKEPPTSIYKIGGAPITVSNAETEGLITIDNTSRQVKPFNLGIIWNLGRDYFENNQSYAPYMMTEIAKDFVEREYYAICKGLETYAKIVSPAKQKGNLSMDDIWNADIALSHKGANPDIIIMPMKQRTNLQLQNSIIGYWDMKDKSKVRLHYAGSIARMIEVYWARFLVDSALMTDKDEVLIQKTPLEFSFDSMENPTRIVLKEWLVCAPTFDEAVAKITF